MVYINKVQREVFFIPEHMYFPVGERRAEFPASKEVQGTGRIKFYQDALSVLLVLDELGRKHESKLVVKVNPSQFS